MKYIDQLEAHGPGVQRLIESKHQNRCHHALLFCGPSGIGKKLAAKAFCQGVICEQAQEAPCGNCNPCRKVYEGIHPDVLIVGAEGRSETVKIASIRNIQTFLSKTRNEGSCSVVVIQDADTMNAESQNALLKVLEEPMPNVYFVLISDSTENMLETVLSRCHLIQFKTLNTEQLSKILGDSGFSDQEQRQLMTLAEGSAGRAISIGRAGIGQTVPAILD
ncbi:MAG: DNA polymerase III subunit delta', partial [Candidatus Omnitrophica bacterium]|nr:DNA polymerase III subunit delta' [Candidatus Omnitrophota bacterium]